jgi:dinuclear metal center YbgI/SA1388 family protein
MRLDALTRYLDDYLRLNEEVADPPEALNGLQLENRKGEVTRLAAAVDVCEATIRMAAEQAADLLLVHHGLFWGGPRPLVGPAYRRTASLIENGVALYSAHLPLDRHPEVGNNAVLARLLEVKTRGEFGSYRGSPIGTWGELDVPRDEVARRLTTVLGTPPRLFPFGSERVRRIGIVTGAGGSLIPQVAAAGLDAYVTGEGQHWTFFDAEELRLNVFYAGHYATETVGVKALAEHVSRKFSIPWIFLDHPTGL